MLINLNLKLNVVFKLQFDFGYWNVTFWMLIKLSTAPINSAMTQHKLCKNERTRFLWLYTFSEQMMHTKLHVSLRLIYSFIYLDMFWDLHHRTRRASWSFITSVVWTGVCHWDSRWGIWGVDCVGLMLSTWMSRSTAPPPDALNWCLNLDELLIAVSRYAPVN